jgi:hypothetical protein
VRTSARTAGAVAAIAVGALLVSGCGSSDDKGGNAEGGGGSSKPEASASAETSQPAADDEPAALPGVWKAQGKQYVLTIAGNAVTLLREKSNCTGRVVDEAGKALVLKCPGGTGADRTNGKVGALKSRTMTVSWNGGATDTYTRVAQAPAKLPKAPGDVEKLVPGN